MNDLRISIRLKQAVFISIFAPLNQAELRTILWQKIKIIMVLMISQH